MPLVYAELRRVAHRYMRDERPNHPLQTTALVHEAYVRLVDQRLVEWQNRAQFFGLAAQAMRRILVDHARSRGRAKRGSDAPRVAMDTIDPVATPDAVDREDAVALDIALKKLEAIDPGQARIVELRFFGGLNVEETAEVLSSSASTIKREWALARAWLRREVSGLPPEGQPPKEVLELIEARKSGDFERAADLHVRIWADGFKRGGKRAAAAVRTQVRRMGLEALENQDEFLRATGFLTETPLQPPAAWTAR